jgi:hypothetical protein
MVKNIYNVPLFIQAKTNEDLIKKMQRNNLLNDTMFEYYQIYEDKSGKITAWFRADLLTYKWVK